MVESKDIVWYTINEPTDGVRYYNIVSNEIGSLCPNPECNHQNRECILFHLKPVNLLVSNNYLIVLATNIDTGLVGFYSFDFENSQFRNIYTFQNGGVYNNWCVSRDSIYCIYTTNGETNDIYKLGIAGNAIKPIKINLKHQNMIYDFGLYGENVYYYNDGQLTCNGKPYVQLVAKFRYQIFGDYIYYTKYTFEPEWDSDENPENVKYMQWAYDLYRRSLIDSDSEEQLLIKRGYGYFVITNTDIYYLPYDISTAFSYPMPAGNDNEFVHVYNMSGGKINRFNLDSQITTTVFCKTDFLIERLLVADDYKILFIGTDYSKIDVKDATASDYYDNTSFYIFSIANNNTSILDFDIDPVIIYP